MPGTPRYTKQTWSDYPSTSTPISAARLGVMEDGIELASVAADLFPRKSQQWYTTTHPLSGTNTDANVFGTSGTRGFLLPFAVTHAHSIDAFGLAVSTAGTSGTQIRMAIYPHDQEWGTVNKVVSASTAGDSTGDKNATITSTPLSVGMYWLFVGVYGDSGGTIVVRRGNGFGQGAWGGGVTFYYGEWSLRYDSLTLSSDAPSSIALGSPSQVVVNDVPLVYVRKT